MKKDNLKPCPFCGSKNIIIDFEYLKNANGILKRFWAECQDCNAGYRNNPRFRKDDAVKVWNDSRKETTKSELIKVFTVAFRCDDPYDTPTEDDIMDALTFGKRIESPSTFTCTEVYMPREGIEVEVREVKR